MLKPYDEYKETNIPWLNKVPSHWECKKLITIFSENKGLNLKLDSINAYQFKFGVLIAKKKYEINEELAKTYRKYTLIQSQDIMINGLNLNYDFLTQRVALVKEDGIITSAYISLRPRKNTNSKYYTFLFKSLDSKKIFNGMGSGIRLTLDFSQLKRLVVSIPPREEQDQIVKYLDFQTSKINTLIKAKKKQIELLKEQKQAVINKAVTKGLDDTVPMKDSGVEWLGEVPEHWKVNKIKQHFSIKKSIAGKEGFNVLSVTQQGLKIKDVSKNEGQMAANYSNYQFVNKEDFVMNHMDLLTGYVDYSQYFGVTSPDYRVFSLTTKKFEAHFCLAIFQLCYKRKIFYGLGQGAALQGRWRLPKDNFLNFELPVPPLQEQQAIVTYLEEKTALIDKAISVIEKEIELVSEYKTSLISSVVTGKIDVRDVVVLDFEVVEGISENIENDEVSDK